jgi:hypothetical protein
MVGTKNQVFENRVVRLIDFRHGALTQKTLKMKALWVSY